MKNIVLIAFALMLSLAAIAQVEVMTYNIRYNTKSDDGHAWPNRKDRLVATLYSFKADIMGLQEVLAGQKKDLEEMLKDYKTIGVGRDDGKDEGEFALIMYKKDKFKVLESGTFWLSKTPDVPGSKDWDAAITRICTWAKFKDKDTKKEFYVFNTHFDHKGVQAREESAKVIREKIKEIAGEEAPVILMGDFNCDNASPEYFAITGFSGYVLTDAFNSGYDGPNYTLAPNFQAPDYGQIIDYIFYSSKVSVSNVRILDNETADVYPSDHLPVMARVKF